MTRQVSLFKPETRLNVSQVITKAWLGKRVKNFLRAMDFRGAASALIMGSNTGRKFGITTMVSFFIISPDIHHHLYREYENILVHKNREREEVFTGRRCNKCWCSNGEIRFLCFVFVLFLYFVYFFCKCFLPLSSFVMSSLVLSKPCSPKYKYKYKYMLFQRCKEEQCASPGPGD